MTETLLSVRNLEKHYPISEGILARESGRVRAVDGVSFDVARGETLGLIGESGSGKSTVASSMVRLETPTGGEVFFDGERVADHDDDARRDFRRRVGVVFQNPDSSLDPRMTVGDSIAEPLAIHNLGREEQRRELVEALLERVGLSASDADRYPHSLSGGQKQRAAIARALVVNPDLLVADEPVSALDASVQADILALLDDLKRDFDLGVLFISHDMAVVREVCDRVAVMYLGEIVERGPTQAVLADPQHPYTRALAAAIPRPDPTAEFTQVDLSGEVPDAANPPAGCRFHTRCPEIIQPDGYDFEQGNWRAVMDLRVALADGFDHDALEAYAATEGSGENGDSPDLHAAVRDRYEIPAELTDSDAESVLADAIESLVEGDATVARETLSREFETICERERTGLGETDGTTAGHSAACHLHDAADAATERAVESQETD
ncbi:ABC transporter ATP-binding protein [Halorussus halophilus]|uniref:ABC transporter ATP-binding protein n=1 Tax=Halorussus halophilus TaxID=2650975 RepID=UPI0013014F47|nr:oligopeptide/dipeptide ABC transporter ATP-binding protein [Halorussus halophilus]